MSAVDLSRARWIKSSRSSGVGGNGNCVEVAVGAAAVGVRDSKNAGAGHLVFGGSAWQVFAEGLKG